MGDIVKKGKKVEGIKERMTKTEKRLKKMYAEWRVEDAKIKEQQEEFEEQQEEAEERRQALQEEHASRYWQRALATNKNWR